MKFLKNENGVALVTALMLTLISLGIVMSLMLMVTRSTVVSGMNKRYKTSVEAAYGGTEILTKDIMPMIFRNYSASNLATMVQTDFSVISPQLGDQTCLQAKLTKATANWPSNCSKQPNPKQSPDVSFQLTAVAGNPFMVYSKIVDTSLGNSDQSGLQLEGAGVAESSTVITPQHFPYIYRLEIQGERQNISSGQANIEVLYAY
ncbi:MAG TPA: hypothetical protein PL053_07780 [Deltaproteobacteria bacterium]|nr:hypothetical protein [Deltaproteobacteria bacterium]